MDADVIIIGAGPAGSTAALLLARAGRSVLVLEKASFPRPKICGGCLSGSAVAFLERQFNARSWPGTPVERIQFFIGSYQLSTAVRGRTRIVERAEFDQFLADAARRAGAQFIFGSAARLVRSGEGFAVELQGERLRAKFILVASGIGAMAAEIAQPLPAANRRLIGQQWIETSCGGGLPGVGQVEMHWLRGGYVGLAAPREACTIVAYAAETSGGDARPAWARLRDSNPESKLWDVLGADAPQRNGARGAAGFPWRPRCVGRENVLLIGDAAGYREPFSGEGMGQAMHSAEHAVCAILSGANVQARYAVAMKKYHTPRLRRLDWLGRALRIKLIERLASGPAILPQALVARAVEWIHVQGTT